MPKEPKTQSSRRRDITAKDQFGRPWSGSIDVDAGDFTGIILAAGWSDPLRTPQHLIRMPKNEFGQLTYGRVEIDFDRWIRDQKKSNAEWMRTFYSVGKQLYAARFDPHEHANDAYLLEQTGPRPRPTVECLEAALDENHKAHLGLLGLAPLNDEAVTLLGLDPEAEKAIREAGTTQQERDAAESRMTVMQFLSLEPTYQEFLKWGRGQGMTMAEVNEKWELHKQLNATPEEGEQASEEQTLVTQEA